MSPKRFLRDARGGAAVLFAIVLPVTIGASAMAVDLSHLYTVKNVLQTTADAAALAAAQKIGTPATAKALARQIAAKNVPAGFGTVVKDTDIVFGLYDPETKLFTAGVQPANAVSVTASRDTAHGNAAPWFLATAFGRKDAAVSATGIAAVTISACVVALDPSSSKAFAVSGNGSVNVPNCGIHVNSSASVALEQKGSSEINAKTVTVVGGANGSNIDPDAQEGAPVLKDPMASLPEPAVPAGCTYTNKTFGTAATLPGGSTYCGDIRFAANITFGAGIHYFKNAEVEINSNIDITGTDMMLYFDKDSDFKSTSSGSFTLNAMTSGPYKGIAIFGARGGSMQTFRMTGSKEFFINGAVYLPNGRLEVYGSADVTVSSKSGYVVARQFFYQGDSSFTLDSFGGATAASFGSGNISLVH